MKSTESQRSYYNQAYRTSWKRRLQVMLGRARTAARKMGYGRVTVDYDDLLAQLEAQDYKDYFTGDALSLDSIRDALSSPSLDRYDNEKSYLKGNIIFTTYAVNRAKNNLPVEDFLVMCRKVARKFPGEIPPPKEVEVIEAPDEEEPITVPDANWMSNMIQRQLEEMKIAPLTGLRDLSWQEERETS